MQLVICQSFMAFIEGVMDKQQTKTSRGHFVLTTLRLFHIQASFVPKPWKS